MKGKKTADLSLFLTVTGLLLASLAFVYTASATFSSVKMATSESMLFSHAQKVLLAFGAMLFFTKVDYHIFQKNSKYIILSALALLMAVLVMGTVELGARRWLSLGFISFQPAEFAKFALVIHISAMCAAKAEYIGDFKKAFLPIMVWALATAGLIVLQPNMSTASVLIMITFAIMFIAQVPLKYMISCGIIAFVGGFMYALTATYRLHRILAFLGFENEHSDRVGYQGEQGLIALGNGGLFGVGIGQSRQRDFYLPESYGDFIFAVIGEEYGYIGAAALMLAFAFVLIRGIQITKHAPDMFGRYVAFGITTTVAIYTLVNSFVNTGLMPVTGLPMPFVSYGGTSMIFTAAAVGVLLNISKHAVTLPDAPKLTLGQRMQRFMGKDLAPAS